MSAGSLNVTGELLLEGALTAADLAVTGVSLLRLGGTTASLNVTEQPLLQGAVTAGALNVTGASLLQLDWTYRRFSQKPENHGGKVLLCLLLLRSGAALLQFLSFLLHL